MLWISETIMHYCHCYFCNRASNHNTKVNPNPNPTVSKELERQYNLVLDKIVSYDVLTDIQVEQIKHMDDAYKLKIILDYNNSIKYIKSVFAADEEKEFNITQIYQNPAYVNEVRDNKP